MTEDVTQAATDAPHPCLAEFWGQHGARFAELLAVGGSRPKSYGFISWGRGAYGRIGLEQDEYFEYLQLTSYVEGMVAALGGARSPADLWLGAQLERELARAMAAGEAEQERSKVRE